DIPLLELTASRAEAELGECQRMLDMRNEADRRLRHWQDMLAEATTDLTHAEMRLAGQDFMVATANAKLRDATEQLRDVILHRLRSEARIEEMEKRLAVVKNDRHKHAEDHARLTHEIDLFYYTKRGSQVVTPIGWATVNSYREGDQMLVVALPFCRPSARMWIPVEKVWQLDRAGQQAENVGMGAEDSYCCLLYRRERATIVRECGSMLTEERATREMMREEREIGDERRLASKIVAQAKATAPRLAKMHAVSEYRSRWVAYQVQKAVERRKKDIARWEARTVDVDDDSVESAPKPRKVRGALERAVMTNRFRKDFVQLYIKTHVKNAELRVAKMLELRAKERVEAAIMDHIIGTYLSEFVKDVAQETLKAGLLAKKRAEDETGLVFPDPSHMQYGVYRIFRSWWVGRKEELQRSVERWNIVIAKNREKWEREHARVAAAQQTFLNRGLKEEARIRVAKVCSEMAKEERATKAFNSWELVMILREKRRMMDEELFTRRYMRSLELQRREQERQSKLKTAAEVKEERQQKWQAMTEEEKEDFLEEEKVAKKQEWTKKQAVLLGLAPADVGDGGSIGEGNTYASAASSRERRRLSIKAAKVHRRKQEIEISTMEAEDERSKLENQAHRAMLEVRHQRQIEMAKKAAAMRRQMAAEVSTAGGGQVAASIVHSMGSSGGGGSGGSGDGAGGGSNGGGGGKGGRGGADDGDKSVPEGGRMGIEGSAGGDDGGNIGGGPTLFDEEYVSSSESELAEEDRVFAEDMGLPTGDADLQDSDHSSDEEDVKSQGGKTSKSKAAKAKADAAAAAAAKAAENSWLGGGGGRWGVDRGGGGDEKAEGEQEEKDGNNHELSCDDEIVASAALRALEGLGDGVNDNIHGRAADGCAPAAKIAGAPAAEPGVARSSRVTGVWEIGERKTLGGKSSSNCSRPSTSSSCDNSTNDWNDSSDDDRAGGGGGKKVLGDRPKTATERAKAKRRREMLTDCKIARTGTGRSSSAPPPCNPAGGKTGGRGNGGQGGLGGQRRMFSDD
ncbi:unnamed protein product, partial [Hapterophycus canaliculatus]